VNGQENAVSLCSELSHQTTSIYHRMNYNQSSAEIFSVNRTKGETEMIGGGPG